MGIAFNYTPECEELSYDVCTSVSSFINKNPNTLHISIPPFLFWSKSEMFCNLRISSTFLFGGRGIIVAYLLDYYTKTV